ncbi:MAG TPA: redoxin domain-containing protein [Candidatus Angelobacter sp.]|jgi:cytochrome oxidase Cu insertion factor (SCO1/SenC/PrrC family)|nr:redoxin domain-containing protein [Candidatus Angelobacter sp.]
MRRIAVLLMLWMLALAAPQTRQSWAQEKKEGPPEPKFKVGDMAPDFTLNDTNMKPVKLSDFRGKKSVALAFYIFAFTGG